MCLAGLAGQTVRLGILMGLYFWTLHYSDCFDFHRDWWVSWCRRGGFIGGLVSRRPSRLVLISPAECWCWGRGSALFSGTINDWGWVDKFVAIAVVGISGWPRES